MALLDHPRIRGEHALAEAGQERAAGSSPHTRGAHPLWTNYLKPLGIIPAYAGSTPERHCFRGESADHPRIRGEHVVPLPGATLACGSSPHTRGARERISRLNPRTADHPRIRGEHGRTPANGGALMGSSPHTRGARRAPEQ